MSALEKINEATPIAMCTVGQFIEYLQANGLMTKERATSDASAAVSRNETMEKTSGNEITRNIVHSESRKIYGLKGIADEFSCSISTAQKYKKEIFGPIIIQNGHKIIMDAEKAWEYYEMYNRKKKKHALKQQHKSVS